MADPRRLFDAKDIEAAGLYANLVTGGAEDFYPLKVDANGYLLISMTVGSVSLSSTASTITNSVGNPVNVSLTSTKVTIESAGLNVTLTSTEVTVKSAVSGFNVNIATATLGTVTTSLSSTIVTVQNVAAGFNVNVATATLGTVTVTGTVTPSTTASTISNAVGNPVNVSLTSTAVTVSNTAGTVTNSVSTLMLISKTLTGTSVSINATTGTIAAAGSARLKVYAISLTTTATTSSVITFVNGTYGGQVLWKAVYQAASGSMAGSNIAVTPPAYLFATGSAQLLRLNLSAAIPVEVSVSYYDEA